MSNSVPFWDLLTSRDYLRQPFAGTSVSGIILVVAIARGHVTLALQKNNAFC
jgi:hypothetical protein